MHIACSNGRTPCRVIRLLHEQFAKAIELRSGDGKTPFHCAIRSNLSTKVLEYVIEAHPHAVSLSHYDGDFPIFIVCELQSPLRVEQLLMGHFGGQERHGDELAIRSPRLGRSPLHYAGLGETETLQLLLKRDPAGVHMMDNNGILPLHCACFHSRNRNSQENVRLILKVDLYTVLRPAYKVFDGATALQLSFMTSKPREIRQIFLHNEHEAERAVIEAFSVYD